MNKRVPVTAVLLLMISALLAACASGGASREYNYLLPAANEPVASSRLPRLRVNLAGYLDQAGVVVETGPTSVHAARRHLWAEPLPSQLQRALAHHLAAAGVGDAIRNTGNGRLAITVTRFQGTTDGQARISGQWRYQSEQSEQKESLERSGHFDINRPLDRDGYPALITRLDAAWQAVAEQIAAELR